MNDIVHAGIAELQGAIAVASVIVDRHLDTKSGWWLYFNYFTRTVTGYGRQ